MSEVQPLPSLTEDLLPGGVLPSCCFSLCSCESEMCTQPHDQMHTKSIHCTALHNVTQHHSTTVTQHYTTSLYHCYTTLHNITLPLLHHMLHNILSSFSRKWYADRTHKSFSFTLPSEEGLCSEVNCIHVQINNPKQSALVWPYNEI